MQTASAILDNVLLELLMTQQMKHKNIFFKILNETKSFKSQ